MPVATIAFHNLYHGLNRDNRLFEQPNAAIGDDLLLPFAELRRHAASQGITVATTAVLAPEKTDAYVFIDMPDPDNRTFTRALSSGRPLYLLVLESRLVRPQNYDPKLLARFRRIFTYDDTQVDGGRFLKLNYAFRLPNAIPHDLAAKQKLCVMIAGYKKARHPQELYGERLKVIRWFEAHHPQDFDLYGVGWDTGELGRHLPQRIIRRCGWLARIGAPKLLSYRGRVERKRDVMGRYRFAFCYENIRDVPGYITEKIFDAFFSGTVPVYRGAGNVTDHIPSGCFVDLRKFSGYDGLYKHLHEMPDGLYLEYLGAIEHFLNSATARPFSCEYFAKSIISEIVHG